MANRAAQGAVGTPFAVDIERGKIREFADATKSANPACEFRDETGRPAPSVAAPTAPAAGPAASSPEFTGAPLVDVELACTNQDSAVAVQAWATFERAKR